MQSNSTHRNGLVVFLFASLALHGLLLTLTLTPLEPEPHNPAPRIVLVPEPETQRPIAPPPAAETGISSTPAKIAQDSSQRANHDIGNPQPRVPPRRSREETTRPATELRQQVLELAGQSIDPDDANQIGSLSGLGQVPRLPGSTGWMDAHLGPVTTGTERWQGADGSMSSRTILASGQVVCTSVRSPTMDEIFNPWMSSALSMLKNCGRERPHAFQDPHDPWQRPRTQRE